jgi:hypothetical protein
MLTVTRERVVWQRTGVLRDTEFEFAADSWWRPAARAPARRTRKARR